MLAQLREEGVSTQYVVRDKQIQRDSGFVAHRADGELVSAVSSMPIEDIDFNTSRLKSAINKASVVVADCNLSGTQLALIAQLCAENRRKLIVAGVSETKCKRIELLSFHSDGTAPITCLCLNRRESRALMGKNSYPADPEFATRLCHAARAEHVVVTEGKDGWVVYSADGACEKFESPKVGAVVSSSGSGDAVVSAIANYLALHGQLEWRLLKTTVHRFVDRVLRKRVASGTDLTCLETLALSQSGLAKRLSEPKVRIGAIAAGIVASLGLLAGTIQAGVSLENSKVILPRVKNGYCWVFPASTYCVSEKANRQKTLPESN